MDTFVDAPDAATRVEDDFGPLEHAPTKRETAAPVTTNPIAILRITCPIFRSRRTTRPRPRRSRVAFTNAASRSTKLLNRSQPPTHLFLPVADEIPVFRPCIGFSHGRTQRLRGVCPSPEQH